MSDVSVLGRFGEIISLFSETRPAITLDLVQQALAVSEATGYRYLSALVDLGLLSRTGAGYALGPKVMELNYLMQQHDPLILCAGPLISDLAQRACAHVLVSKLYGIKLVNMAYAKGRQADRDVDFVPGRRLLPFRGAQARAVLSVMDKRRLRKLYDAHPGDADRDAIGADWKAFCKALLADRRRGYYLSLQELDKGVNGIAAAVLDANGDVLGSLVLAYRLEDGAERDIDALAIMVRQAAAELSAAVAKISE